MSDNSAERRLQLIKSVREEHARNQMTLRRREGILYGQSSSLSYETPAYSPYSIAADAPSSAAEEGLPAFSSFKLRFFIAIGLFIAFLALDSSRISLGTLTMEKVYTYITQDITANSFDFMADLTYTLDNAFSDETK